MHALRSFTSSTLVDEVSASVPGATLELRSLALQPGAVSDTTSAKDILLGTLAGGTSGARVRVEGAPLYSGPKLTGSAGFFPAGRRFVSEWSGGDLTYLLIGFDAHALAPDELDHPAKDSLVCAEDELTVALQRTIARELLNPWCDNTAVYTESLVVTLRLHVLRRCSNAIPTAAARETVAVERARAFIGDNLGSKLDLTIIAEAAGLSRPRLMRAFKARMGRSVSAYVMAERAELARILLETTLLPVGVIARQVGYANHGHLTSQFHARYGMTPTAYRFYQR